MMPLRGCCSSPFPHAALVLLLLVCAATAPFAQAFLRPTPLRSSSSSSMMSSRIRAPSSPDPVVAAPLVFPLLRCGCAVAVARVCCRVGGINAYIYGPNQPPSNNPTIYSDIHTQQKQPAALAAASGRGREGGGPPAAGGAGGQGYVMHAHSHGSPPRRHIHRWDGLTVPPPHIHTHTQPPSSPWSRPPPRRCCRGPRPRTRTGTCACRRRRGWWLRVSD